MTPAPSHVDVAILGAGPAGLCAALTLARRGFRVHLIERSSTVGGNAGSFELSGQRVDYGSHRLHPASDPDILAEIRSLLGDDLLERPRHGRIRLLGRFVHFPLRPVDLGLRLHPRFIAGVGWDTLRKPFSRKTASQESFASVLEAGLGSTICREFYFPYSRKIWGLEPDQLSATQAKKRVSAGSLGKMIRRLLPGRGTSGGGATTKGIFYYPRLGFGQICEVYRDAAIDAGVRLHLETEVTRLERVADRWRLGIRTAQGDTVLEATHVWSTIPTRTIVRGLHPTAPEDVRDSAERLELRAMILVYLTLDQDRFTEYDAHYFPEEAFPFTRLSEPKNYAALPTPRGTTVLCAELPCSTSEALWTASDAELGETVREGLERAGLPIRVAITHVTTRRLPAAYPIYRAGFEPHFERVDAFLGELEGFLSFGRQGLFAHDNTHHAMFMAKSAAACLRADGSFDRGSWAAFREVFRHHVVED